MSTTNRTDVAKTAAISGSLVASLLAFVVAGLVPLVRFSIAHGKNAFGRTLWAEDGMFIYSADQVGIGTIFAPYRGYLHVAPRFLANVISLFPIASWAVVGAIIYSVISGLIAMVIYHAARTFTITIAAALFLALIPSLSPLMGIEAIGSIANLNVVLAYVAVILGLAFKHIVNLKSLAFAGSVMLLVIVILTTPTTGPYLMILVYLQCRNETKRRRFYGLLGLILMTSCIQIVISLIFSDGRTFNINFEQINNSLTLAFDAVLSIIPGMSFQTTTLWGHGFTPIGWVKPVAVLLLVLFGVVGVSKKPNHVSSLMLLSGFFLWFAAVSRGDAYIGSSRYFLYLILPLVGSFVLLLDKQLSYKKLVVAISLLIFLWTPGLAVSEFRTSGGSWTNYIDLAKSICKSNASASVDVQFAPNWPIDWGLDLSGVNSNEWDCKN